MYKVSIPINCDKFHRTRDKQVIWDEFLAFDADRVMLNFETALDGQVLLCDEREHRRQIDRMREAARRTGNSVLLQIPKREGTEIFGLQLQRKG